MWLAIVLCQNVIAWVICPAMLFYYESNERLPLFKRLIDTFKKGALIFICIICYFVISGFTAREVSIPEEESTSIMRIPNHICSDGKPCYKY